MRENNLAKKMTESEIKKQTIKENQLKAKMFA